MLVSVARLLNSPGGNNAMQTTHVSQSGKAILTELPGAVAFQFQGCGGAGPSTGTPCTELGRRVLARRITPSKGRGKGGMLQERKEVVD